MTRRDFERAKTKMLEKRSTYRLGEFVELVEENGIYSKGTFKQFDAYTEDEKTIILCRMILQNKDTTHDAKCWARKTLKSFGG